MTQEEQNRIREEWEKVTPKSKLFESFYEAIADWWLKHVASAYERGVKDTEERVVRDLSKIFDIKSGKYKDEK